MQKIDISKIKTPNINLTEDAASQIRLSLDNDPYTFGKNFRIHVSGKGCDGFSYQTLFDLRAPEDIIIQINGITIIMAPFTAYYSQNLEVDYIFDEVNELEGFVIKNLNQKMFSGKFWREKPELVPELS